MHMGLSADDHAATMSLTCLAAALSSFPQINAGLILLDGLSWQSRQSITTDRIGADLFFVWFRWRENRAHSRCRGSHVIHRVCQIRMRHAARSMITCNHDNLSHANADLRLSCPIATHQ